MHYAAAMRPVVTITVATCYHNCNAEGNRLKWEHAKRAGIARTSDVTVSAVAGGVKFNDIAATCYS